MLGQNDGDVLGQSDEDVLEQGREYESSNLGRLISNLEKEIQALLQEKSKLTRILEEKDFKIEQLHFKLNSSGDTAVFEISFRPGCAHTAQRTRSRLHPRLGSPPKS